MEDLTEYKFWLKVKISDDCWDWTGPKRKGYGLFFFEGRNYKAHRIAWNLVYGNILDGLCVCHRCDNLSCVRPDHLFLGTHQDNMADMKMKGRAPSGLRNGRHTKPENTVVPRGVKHHLAKVTEEQVREIRRLYDQGITATDLAKKFSVTPRQIWFIGKRKSWKHLE